MSISKSMMLSFLPSFLVAAKEEKDKEADEKVPPPPLPPFKGSPDAPATAPADSAAEESTVAALSEEFPPAPELTESESESESEEESEEATDVTVADIIAQQEHAWGVDGFIAKITRAVRRANELKCDPLQMTVHSENLRLGGYITKRAFRRSSTSTSNSWSRRWLVLYKSGLQYYKSESATEPKGFVPLSADSKVTECEVGRFGSKHPYCFEIELNAHLSPFGPEKEELLDASLEADPDAMPQLPPPKYNNFYVSCDSERQRFMWISHISHAIVDLRTEKRQFENNKAEREKAVRKFEKKHKVRILHTYMHTCTQPPALALSTHGTSNTNARERTRPSRCCSRSAMTCARTCS